MRDFLTKVVRICCCNTGSGLAKKLFLANIVEELYYGSHETYP